MARAMKDSGIEWIGEIPEDWEIKTLSQIFVNHKDKNKDLAIKNLLSLSYGKIKRKDISTNEGLLPESFENYNVVEKNDIVLRLTDLQNDHKSLRVGRVIEKGIITSAYITLRSRENIDTRYYYYLLHTFDIEKGFYGMGAGVRQGLNYDELRKLKILSPMKEKQKDIADYLDRKCAEIDKAIAGTKETIEDYKKYKQAVITEAVCKGLNPDAEMKDSGIEWIGEIPVNWKIKPFKYVMTERNEKNKPVQTNERLSLSIDKGITLYAEKTTNLDRFKDDVSQYKLAYEGDLIFNCMNMIVGAIGYSNYFGCISPAYYAFYDNTPAHFTSKYYEYVFQSKTIRKVLFCLGKGIMAIDRGDDKINTCRLKVSRDDLKCLKVPVPTEDEQKEIVEYLDVKCAEIDQLIKEKERLVLDLEEYKKSMIYEYITGKKEVV